MCRMPQDRSGTQEARGALADRLAGRQGNTSQCFFGEVLVSYHSILGFLREKFDSGFSIRNSSESPEQSFSPLMDTNSHDNLHCLFAVAA